MNEDRRRTSADRHGSGTIMNVVSLTKAGPIQRRVWRALLSNPGAEMTTADLAQWCYPRWSGKPLHKHRIAIVRAATRVAERVRRDRPGGVVFRAFGSKAVAGEETCAFNGDSDQ